MGYPSRAELQAKLSDRQRSKRIGSVRTDAYGNRIPGQFNEQGRPIGSGDPGKSGHDWGAFQSAFHPVARSSEGSAPSVSARGFNANGSIPVDGKADAAPENAPVSSGSTVGRVLSKEQGDAYFGPAITPNENGVTARTQTPYGTVSGHTTGAARGNAYLGDEKGDMAALSARVDPKPAPVLAKQVDAPAFRVTPPGISAPVAPTPPTFRTGASQLPDPVTAPAFRTGASSPAAAASPAVPPSGALPASSSGPPASFPAFKPVAAAVPPKAPDNGWMPDFMTPKAPAFTPSNSLTVSNTPTMSAPQSPESKAAIGLTDDDVLKKKKTDLTGINPAPAAYKTAQNTSL